jgi:hypothetical protein
MALRDFRDEVGREWQVWEVMTTGEDRKTAGFPLSIPERWLAFQSRNDRRRLSPVPEGWSDCTEAELAELLKRATAAGRGRRLIE